MIDLRCEYLSVRYLEIQGTKECIFTLKGKYEKLHTRQSLSRDHQNSNNNDSLLLLFDDLWNVKTNYMV